jgi:phage-related protein
MIDAAPSFADFLVTVIEIIDQLTDSDQISAFFDTLNEGAKGFKGLLDQPAIKGLIDNLGPIFATLSALGVIIDVVIFGFQVLVGYAAFFFLKASGAFDPMIKALGIVKGGLGGVAGILKGAGWVAVIITVIALIIDFYGKFEDFRGMVDRTLEGVGEAFGNLFASIQGLLDALFGAGGLGGIITVLEPIIKNILEILIPFIGGVLEFLVNGISTVIDFITSIVKSVMDVIDMLVRGVLAILSGDVGGGIANIFFGILNVILGVVQAIINGVISGVNLVIDLINGFLSTIANSPIAQTLKDVFGIDMSKAQITKISMVDLTGAVNRAAAGMLASNNRKAPVRLPKLAEGGVIYPSVGGSIVNVAEAGRPERIEPLDPNGLSERDKALISTLTSPAGNTINIYPSAGMDERELAEMVSRRLAFEIRKGAF